MLFVVYALHGVDLQRFYNNERKVVMQTECGETANGSVKIKRPICVL